MKARTPGSILGSRRCTAGIVTVLLGEVFASRWGNLPVPPDPSPGPLSRTSATRFRAGPKKFAEPVSLSSTASADFRLPATAFGLGFDLLALCARRKRQSSVSGERFKGPERDLAAICGNFLFQHFHSQIDNLWTALWKGFGADENPLQRCRSRVDHAHNDHNRLDILAR